MFDIRNTKDYDVCHTRGFCLIFSLQQSVPSCIFVENKKEMVNVNMSGTGIYMQ